MIVFWPSYRRRYKRVRRHRRQRRGVFPDCDRGLRCSVHHVTPASLGQKVTVLPSIAKSQDYRRFLPFVTDRRLNILQRGRYLVAESRAKGAHVLREIAFFGQILIIVNDDMSINFILMDPVRLCDHYALPQTYPVPREHSLTTCGCGLTKI
jgi:hypothetical protein